MHLRAIVLTALALVAAACTSNQRPIPQNAPPPYRAGPYRPPVQQPQPAYPAYPAPTPQYPTSHNPPPVYAQSAPVRQGDVVLEMRGMSCPVKCVRQVKEMLLAAPGVTAVRVDYAAKAAIVTVAPGTDPNSLPRYVRPPYSAHVVSAVAMGTR